MAIAYFLTHVRLLGERLHQRREKKKAAEMMTASGDTRSFLVINTFEHGECSKRRPVAVRARAQSASPVRPECTHEGDEGWSDDTTGNTQQMLQTISKTARSNMRVASVAGGVVAVDVDGSERLRIKLLKGVYFTDTQMYAHTRSIYLSLTRFCTHKCALSTPTHAYT